MNNLLGICLCSVALVAMSSSIAWPVSSNQEDKTSEIDEAKYTMNKWESIYEVRQQDLTIPGLIFINLSEQPSSVNYPKPTGKPSQNAFVKSFNGKF